MLRFVPPKPSTLQLKIFAISLIVLAGVVLSAYGVLYSLFSAERLQQAAKEWQQNNHRHLSFDSSRIGRSLFPRPTLTLHNIVISEPNQPHKIAARIAEMNIGLAWSSVIGEAEIEKWVFRQPEFTLKQNADGTFNLADLFTDSKQNRPEINRLLIHNGSITLDNPHGAYPLKQVELLIRGASSEEAEIEAHGKVAAAWLQSDWRIQTLAQQQNAQWHFPRFQLLAAGSAWQQKHHIKLDSSLTWQTDNQKISFKNLNIQTDLPDYQAHINSTASQAVWQQDAFSAPELNHVITSQHQQAAWDGTLSITKFNLRPTVITAEKVAFSGSRKDGQTNVYLTLDSPLSWQQSQGVQLNKLMLTSRVENTLGNLQQRFHSELAGTFKYQNASWNADLQGLFDRQPAQIAAQFQPADTHNPAQIQAKIQLEKWQSAPYFPANADGIAYPKWLTQSDAPRIDAELAIQTVQFPNAEINDVKTRLLADNKQIQLTDFQAQLYSGKTSGSLSMLNSQPVSYRVQQHAQNVQIRPLLQDLFRYGRLRGQGDARVDLQSKGSNRAELTRNLRGNMHMNLRDGALIGVDLHNVLQQVQNRTLAQSEELFTPFRRFSINSQFENGIGKHQNTELFSDTLNLISQGETDLNQLTLKENITLFPVQGKGKPIPLNIRGKIDNPALTVDFSGLTQGVTSAQEKQKIITDTLKEQWQWLKPKKSSPETSQNTNGKSS
ncbi:MAG: AsmA family protein [Neisseria sp.]|nr:AsmA family protein [Neisseria sp.]